MAYTPKSYDEILADALAHIELYSDVTDFNTGAVIKVLLEAVAEESSEQYFQLSQILKAFSITSARGSALDRRVADFGIARNLARASVTKVRIYDTTVVVGKVAVSALTSGTSLKVFDSSIFPTTGYPYSIRLGEGTPSTQTVTVTGNSLATSTLTVSPLVYDVEVGTSVNLITSTSSRVINSGLQVQIPADITKPAMNFVTMEQAYISPGNTYSNEVYAKATVLGTSGNAAANSIRAFSGSSPFQGASVANTIISSGGREVESDEELQRRAVQQIFGFSAATKLALKAAAKQVIDTVTGKQVKSASVVEDFVLKEVRVYIDDGNGFTPDTISYPVGTAATVSAFGVSVPLTSSASVFPESGNILLVTSSTSELIGYRGKSGSSLLLTSLLNGAHTTPTVYLVDILSKGTEVGQTLFRTTRKPIVRDSEIIFYKLTTGGWSQLSRALYTMNRATGDIALLNAFAIGTQIAISYSYGVNLVAEVTKVLEGDPDDEVNYPGVKAAGVRISVESPILRRISVTVIISSKQGYDELSLRKLVTTEIEQYIASLEVGEDVVASRIEAAAQNVEGVASVKVIDPSDDIVLLEREQASCFSSAGASLVSVT